MFEFGDGIPQEVMVQLQAQMADKHMAMLANADVEKELDSMALDEIPQGAKFVCMTTDELTNLKTELANQLIIQAKAAKKYHEAALKIEPINFQRKEKSKELIKQYLPEEEFNNVSQSMPCIMKNGKIGIFVILNGEDGKE